MIHICEYCGQVQMPHDCPCKDPLVRLRWELSVYETALKEIIEIHDADDHNNSPGMYRVAEGALEKVSKAKSAND